MTVMPPRTHRSTARRSAPRPDASRSGAGRPAVFLTLMALAALIVLWILMTGPTMSIAVALGAVGAVLALVATGWGVAGPHS
ncbi:hypothetical protein [Brachybacterium phenoliresistens]|uniref:Uncharacterized protein n=1 Tax=Brachybacterium phenoliresistens TaxID=396014 RepID=Z9JSJ4_9MICO|nr:hypothetical protein [Brachybacterium phenoliresistens]EWS81154.1 hypothetical protein BF93_18475 [Brachybacterium phenoliresistens]